MFDIFTGGIVFFMIIILVSPGIHVCKTMSAVKVMIGGCLSILIAVILFLLNQWIFTAEFLSKAPEIINRVPSIITLLTYIMTAEGIGLFVFGIVKYIISKKEKQKATENADIKRFY